MVFPSMFFFLFSFVRFLKLLSYRWILSDMSVEARYFASSFGVSLPLRFPEAREFLMKGMQTVGMSLATECVQCVRVS